MRIHCTDDDEQPIMDFADALDRAKHQEFDFSTRSLKESTMATKKAAPQQQQAAQAQAPGKNKQAPAGKQAAQAKNTEKQAEQEAEGKRGVPEGYVGLATLADELGTTPAAMRRRLRSSDIVKPEGHGWAFKEGSKELAAVRKLFTEEQAPAQ